MTRDVVRLMTWLSPAFPTGAFAYSHGLESACDEGLIRSRNDLEDWLGTLLDHGSAWNDAVLCAEAWRRSAHGNDLTELSDLGAALAGSGERHLETMAQGTAFLKAAKHWPNAVPKALPVECPLPVAFGAVAGRLAVPLETLLPAFLHTALSNLVQAVLRLGRLGQGDGVAILAALEPSVIATAERASRSTLDDLGGAAFVSDIMAQRHETLHSRVFRS